MSEKCNAKYKNLNLIQSFSEQMYPTVQLFQQACMNDEWLRQQVEKLKYLSPPAVRTKLPFSEWIDNVSYGYDIRTNELTGDSEVVFNNSLEKSILIDFKDESLIDKTQTTAHIEKFNDADGIHYQAVVPMDVPSTIVDTSTNHKNGNGSNSYWYVGYDKNKPYVVKPAWVKNPKNANIPSIVRAQTFKCTMDSFDSSIKEGLLESVTLLLQNTGEITHGWSSPLYVQIWPTAQKDVTVKKWNKTLKKSETVYETVNGKKVAKKEKIYVPKTKSGSVLSIDKPLAEAVFNPDETSPGWYSIVFDNPAKVKRNEHYAIVVFSPLSHPTHCPRIGGWGLNCNQVKYSNGDAFLSEDNGRTFVRYGRNDDTLSKEEYKFGKYTPQDFAFECKITHSTTGRDTAGNYYLYLAPILANPITKFSIGGEVYGETNGNSSAENVHLTFEYSRDGRTWNPIRMGEPKYFSSNPTNLLFIRAKMSTSVANDTPNIENLYVHLNTVLPKQMYVRTKFFTPKLTPMLGASLWGRVYAPFELTPDTDNITASVEIIQNRVVKETFQIITVSDLDSYLSVQDSSGNFILTEDEITGVSDSARAKYLNDNPDILKKLKESNSNIYVKPYDDYLLSFDGGVDEEDNQLLGGLTLSNGAAYPIIECTMQSDSTEPVFSLGEWSDYTINYDTDTITIKRSVLDDLPTGGLVFKYNPVFLKGLTLSEVGNRVDETTGLPEEGLILDYFKQKFVVTDENVESRRIQLRACPVNPVREVILNKDTDDERELFENVDFTVDYVTNEIVFNIAEDSTQLSILEVGDTLDVVYTPNIEDTGISIGYWVNRDKTDHECIIKPNYIEYKV